MNRAQAFLLCVVPQFLVVAAMTAREELALRAGVEVRLEVRPVDPMSLFAGRYVSVPLAIERLGPLTKGLAQGETVYVRLQQATPYWTAVAATREPPAEGALFLRGELQGGDRVSYGLDTFYIPDNGADPSRLKLTLVLRVTRDGRGLIEDLLVGNQTYAQWNAAQKSR